MVDLWEDVVSLNFYLHIAVAIKFVLKKERKIPKCLLGAWLFFGNLEYI